MPPPTDSVREGTSGRTLGRYNRCQLISIILDAVDAMSAGRCGARLRWWPAASINIVSALQSVTVFLQDVLGCPRRCTSAADGQPVTSGQCEYAVSNSPHTFDMYSITSKDYRYNGTSLKITAS